MNLTLAGVAFEKDPSERLYLGPGHFFLLARFSSCVISLLGPIMHGILTH